MELWVRSQDKEILQKTNALFITHSEENIWSILDNQNMTKYGIYKTYKRALEVLDEIHQRLIDLQTIECTGDYRFTKRNLDCVYEMPKE